jgi:hypothetical protein
MIDGVERPARQLSQPLHGLFTLLDRCDVSIATRGPSPGARGGYAPLKHPSDARFAQLMLNMLRTGGDELDLG